MLSIFLFGHYVKILCGHYLLVWNYWTGALFSPVLSKSLYFSLYAIFLQISWQVDSGEGISSKSYKGFDKSVCRKYTDDWLYMSITWVCFIYHRMVWVGRDFKHHQVPTLSAIIFVEHLFLTVLTYSEYFPNFISLILKYYCHMYSWSVS